MNRNMLGSHVHNSHKIDKEEYYNLSHPNCNKNCLYCGLKLKFKSSGEGGYRSYCNVKCSSKHNGIRLRKPVKPKKEPLTRAEFYKKNPHILECLVWDHHIKRWLGRDSRKYTQICLKI